MTDRQLSEASVTIRWIDHADIKSDLEEIAARERITLTAVVKRAVREEIRRASER